MLAKLSFFKASQAAKTEEKVDIMQLFVKAQERYNKQVCTVLMTVFPPVNILGYVTCTLG